VKGGFGSERRRERRPNSDCDSYGELGRDDKHACAVRRVKAERSSRPEIGSSLHCTRITDRRRRSDTEVLEVTDGATDLSLLVRSIAKLLIKLVDFN
jgi:hypothetical protein